MTFRIRRHLLLLFFFCAVSIDCPPLQAQENSRLELLHAETLENLTRNGVATKRLVGKVKFKRGGAILTCDIAEFDAQQNETRLNGHVKVIQDDAVLTSENGVYQRDTEILQLLGDAHYRHLDQHVVAQRINYQMSKKIVTASGKPVMMDSSRSLTAHHVTFFEEQRYGLATGEAVMHDPVNHVDITGEKLQFYPDQDSLLAVGNPSVVRLDSLNSPVFTIKADSLSVEADYFFAWGNVKINHEDVTGVAGQAVFQRAENYAIMRQDPVLHQGDYILHGDVIQLNLADDKLSSVYIPTNPVFMNNKFLPDTAFVDRLTGKQMAVDLVDNKVQSVTLIGMATSEFHAVEDSTFKGLNVVSGDTLTIKMLDDDVDEILVVGGCQGTYTPAKNADLDGNITYEAQTIRYHIPRESTHLLTDAKVNYQKMSLGAGGIDVDWRKNLLTARSLTDTAGAEDYPQLEQTGEKPLVGTRMVYNMQQNRGQVIAGRTEIDQGYYYGAEMQRITPEVYHVHDGYYTTCDIPDHPHYYFYSTRMKLITNKLVIAKPVVLYIADVPLAILPFAVFPQQKGRRSGFLMPAYDYKKSEGRSLKGLGYYWAINDYMDGKLIVDFYDNREDFLYRGRFNYKIRDVLNGSFSGSLTPDRTGNSGPYRWDIAFNHNHTVDPTMSIRGSGQLSGDANFGRDYYQEQSARLKKELRSNMTLTKRFENTPYSTNANVGYYKNLQVGQTILLEPTRAGTKLTESTITLPTFGFNRASSNLFPVKPNRPAAWYNQLSWNYNSSFNNTITNTYESYAPTDSTFAWQKKSDASKSMRHTLGLTGNTSIAGVMTLSGNVSYLDNWAFRYERARTLGGVVLTDTNNVVLRDSVDGFLRMGTFSVGSNLSTKIYGLMPVGLGALKAVRHIVTPKIGVSYAPDFSTPFWGYIEHYQDSSGAKISYDPYKFSTIGATPTNRKFNITWSLANQFDYKLLRPGKTIDDDPVEVKDKFFTWNLSGSYNMSLDSLQASDIQSGGTVTLGKLGSVTYSSIFEVYDRDSIPGVLDRSQKVNRFIIPRLTTASIGFGFGIQSKTQVAESDSADTTGTDDAFLDTRFEDRSMGQSSGKLWDMRFNFNYSYIHTDPFQLARKSFWMNTTSHVSLTEFWKISYTARFDLIQGQLVSHDMSINRDLHCWALKFTWRPSGYSAGYYLLIQVDASQLKDLKLQHRSQPFRR